MALSQQQERFCHEFVKHGSPVSAYRQAGFKATGPHALQESKRLLDDPEIQARIREIQAGPAEPLLDRIDTILETYEQIACLDPIEVLNDDWTAKPLKDRSPAARQAGIMVRTRVLSDGLELTDADFSSRLTALRALRRCLDDIAPDLPRDAASKRRFREIGTLLPELKSRVKAARKTNPTALKTLTFDNQTIHVDSKIERTEQVLRLVAWDNQMHQVHRWIVDARLDEIFEGDCQLNPLSQVPKATRMGLKRRPDQATSGRNRGTLPHDLRPP